MSHIGRFRTPILASVLLHLFPFVLGLSHFAVVVKKEMDPLEVEVALHFPPQRDSTARKIPTQVSGSKTIKARSAVPGLKLDWIASGIRPRGVTTNQKSVDSVGGTAAHAEGAGMVGMGAHGVARSMSMEREAQLYPFFEELRTKLDLELMYPAAFTELEIAGGVDLEVEIDSAGQFTGKVIRVAGQDEGLKSYALAMAIRALQAPVPAGKLRGWPAGVQAMPIALHVDFELQGYGDAKPARESQRLKNVYHFARRSKVEPRLNREFAKLQKFVPILYLPGLGFAINLVAVYQMIDEWGDTDPGVLARERLQNSRDAWGRLVLPNASPRP